MSSFINDFSTEEILLVSKKEGDVFHYVSGGVGPYYVDLRRGANNPTLFNTFLEKYSEKIQNHENPKPLCFVGVPTTGVVYATGLAIKHNSELAIIEKLNPSRIHIFSNEILINSVRSLSSDISEEHLNKCAFLGLEDMGVMYATVLGIKYSAPSAIFRRVPKGHGTSKTIEANLAHFIERGITHLYVVNDPYYPQSPSEILATLNSILNIENFGVTILTPDIPSELLPSNLKDHKIIEIEDLWTTGTSAINLHKSILATTNKVADIVVFLDRQQGAYEKFSKLNINATCVYTITDIANFLLKSNLITREPYDKVMGYVSNFQRVPYTDNLVKFNESGVCVGIDITPSLLPENACDTTLPNFPYARNSEGVKQYCLDLLDEITKVPTVRVIKPNLAYYNSFSDVELHQIVSAILERAHELNLLVILDAKIGDIARTQAQYAEKYKNFDSVTAHGYMGSDSIFPITDAGLGCYVLVFTSNPSRSDFETQIVVNPNDVYSIVTPDFLKKSKRIYHLVAEKVAEWQFAGSVGAVVGGTPNAEGKLQELQEIIGIFADKLDYLPPILIPGVGTQGGSATDVMTAIVQTLQDRKWDEPKIRSELRKVVINSSSTIDYSPRPKDAIVDLVTEIREAVNSCFSN